MKTFPLLMAVILFCALASIPVRLVARTVGAESSVVDPGAADLSYRAVSSLHRDKTTDQEVKDLLGLPTMVDAEGQQTQWYYKTDKVSLHIRFNADHTLAGYEYKSSDSLASSKIEAQQLKSLFAGATDADLIRIVGEPTYAIVSGSGKELYYRSLSNESILQVAINDEAGLITNYLFLEEGPKDPSVDLEKVIDIVKGQTTAAELTGLFGKPTKRMIDQDKESWYYLSADMKLLVNFNRDDN